MSEMFDPRTHTARPDELAGREIAITGASDRLGRNYRALLLALGLAATAAALLILTGLRPASAGTVLPVAMIGVVANTSMGVKVPPWLVLHVRNICGIA